MASRRHFLRSALASTVAGRVAWAGAPRPPAAMVRPGDGPDGIGPHADPPAEPHVLAVNGRGYRAFAISRDGSLVVIAGGSVIHAWSGATGARLADIGRHGPNIAAVQFSVDGRRLLTRSSAKLVMLRGAISETGYYAGASVKVWDLGLRHRVLGAFEDDEPLAGVWPVFGAPDGSRVYFLDQAGGLHLWDVGRGGPKRFVAEQVDDDAKKIDMSSFSKASDDGTRVVGGGLFPNADGEPRPHNKIWDVETGRVRVVELLTDGGPKGAALTSPDARFEVWLEAGDSSNYGRRFLTTLDLQTGRVVRRFETPRGIMVYVHLVALSTDNTRFAVGSQGRGRDPEVTLWIWNVRDGRLLASYRCPRQSVPQAVAWLDDGRLRVVSKAKQRVETPNGQSYEESLLIWETGPV